MRALREVVQLMREYCWDGAKELAPLLDPASGGSPSTSASRQSAIQSAAAIGVPRDVKAACVVGWIIMHPKPQWALRKLQEAYASPDWGGTTSQMRRTLGRVADTNPASTCKCGSCGNEVLH